MKGVTTKERANNKKIDITYDTSIQKSNKWSMVKIKFNTIISVCNIFNVTGWKDSIKEIQMLGKI